MSRSPLRSFILPVAYLCLSVGSVRAEVVIERLSSLVESTQTKTVAPAEAQGESATKPGSPPIAPPTMMGALSIVEDTEKKTSESTIDADLTSTEDGSLAPQLRDLWQMRRLAIRTGNDEAALESERLLEEALLERRAISSTPSKTEQELAYVLLLEAAGAERVGAHSSAAVLVRIAGIAAPTLPAVHVARARLAWGGTGDFGTVFDGLAAAWVAISKNEILVCYAGAGFTLCFLLGCALAMLGLGLATIHSVGSYLLVDLHSRSSPSFSRWHLGALVFAIGAAPLVLGAGPILTPLVWLTVLGAYLNAAQQRALRGAAFLAAALPVCAWLAASWVRGAMDASVNLPLSDLAPLVVPSEELYADVAGALFWGLPLWASSGALLLFPMLWGWGWKNVAHLGLVGACDVCGAATRRELTSRSTSKGQDSVVCPLCVIRARKDRADCGEKSTERPILRPRIRISRGAIGFWTLVWPGWGHLLLGQVGRGFRYLLGAGFMWCAWAWWASPIPWPEPVLVGEDSLALYLLIAGSFILYVSAFLSCRRRGMRGGQRAD